jgi:hypothetical protein
MSDVILEGPKCCCTCQYFCRESLLFFDICHSVTVVHVFRSGDGGCANTYGKTRMSSLQRDRLLLWCTCLGEGVGGQVHLETFHWQKAGLAIVGFCFEGLWYLDRVHWFPWNRHPVKHKVSDVANKDEVSGLTRMSMTRSEAAMGKIKPSLYIHRWLRANPGFIAYWINGLPCCKAPPRTSMTRANWWVTWFDDIPSILT